MDGFQCQLFLGPLERIQVIAVDLHSLEQPTKFATKFYACVPRQNLPHFVVECLISSRYRLWLLEPHFPFRFHHSSARPHKFPFRFEEEKLHQA